MKRFLLEVEEKQNSTLIDISRMMKFKGKVNFIRAFLNVLIDMNFENTTIAVSDGNKLRVLNATGVITDFDKYNLTETEMVLKYRNVKNL